MTSVWSDEAITSVEEDEFGWGPYATQIATLIQSSHSWDHSIVFGLTGPWGSGKSSMLALIEKELAASEDEQKWHIAQFTPWATSDVDGLLGEFYASLGDALPSDRSKDLREKLGMILQISAPAAKLIPFAGGVAAEAVKQTGQALQRQPSWSKAFQLASDELKALKTPVLVVADDIDRLHGEELLALLKVVRLLGRFPGVSFLLAYDEQTVTETLAETGIAGKGKAAGRRFMEKIVQYPLAVPPLLPTQVLSRLDEGLKPCIDLVEQPELFRMRLHRLRKVLLSQLPTPRAIDRYLAQVRHHVAMFDHREVQLEDIIILTLLKTSFPVLYNQLPRLKDQLLTGMKDGMGKGLLDSGREVFDLSPLLETIPLEDQADSLLLLEDLFPGLRQKGKSYLSRSQEGSIDNKHYFDRYFAMGVPHYDVSDADVAQAITAAVGGDNSQLRELLLEQNTERVFLVIDKAEPRTDLFEKDAERLAILITVIPLLGEVAGSPATFLSPKRSVKEWSSKLLSQLSDEVEVSSVRAIVDLATNPLDKIDLIRFMLIRNGNRSWTEQVIDHASKQLTDIFMDNLRDRDNAPVNEEAELLILALGEWGRHSFLTAQIEAGLKENAFTIADVAARCVSTSRSSRGEEILTQLDDFNGEFFNLISHDTDSSWGRTQENDVDKNDLSWENRRRFAAHIASEGSDS